MAKQFDALNAEHIGFIERQKIFFIGSACAGSKVNLSPKGTDLLRVLGANQVGYLDLTGSGNETAAHTLAGGPVTFMFCAFEGPPLILRLYGQAAVHGRGSAGYAALVAGFGETEPGLSEAAGREPAGARQIVVLQVAMVQTSCGYAVPRFAPLGRRDGLDNWARGKGEAGLAAYRAEKNAMSLDGLPTGILG